MNVLMFPGQGSQVRGMGEELFKVFPEYAKKADEVLGYSIEELCLRDPERQLNQTRFTQPAIYVIGVLSYLRRVMQGGAAPDWVLGHSVGEYCALFAAAAFDFETGLRLVKRRAELMSEAGEGGMAAVIGLSETKVREILQRLRSDLDLANINSDKQCVIAGPRPAVEAAQSQFEAEGARFVMLHVSGAFHSRYMEGARGRFASYLGGLSLGDPRYPVLSNLDARPYQPGELRTRLADQIRCPVRWLDSIRYLDAKGARVYEEIGASKVLMPLVAQIRGQA